MTDIEAEPSKFQEWLWDHPFMQVGGSSADGFFFIPIYGNRYYRQPWFRLTVLPIYSTLCSINRAKWWLQHRLDPRHRYHVIRTDLRPGYHDQDERILHACMAELCSYVECHEGPEKLAAFSAELRTEGGTGPADMVCSQADMQDESVAIYRWWKFEKPADELRRNEMMNALFGKKSITTKPVENSELVELISPEFDKDEERLYGEFRAIEAKIEVDEQAMLHRLIDIRQGLWT